MYDSVGVLGGTFNPVHNGHIEVAKAAYRELGFKKIVMLPNGNPPHKIGDYVIDPRHRLNMVSIAAEEYDFIEVSDYEIKRSAKSYTVDTQRVLRQIYRCPIYFIIGADSLCSLHLWKSPEILVKECGFVVADRNFSGDVGFSKSVEFWKNKGADIRILTMDTVDVTSTDIRRIAKDGGDISAMVPPGVCEYINKNLIYQ